MTSPPRPNARLEFRYDRPAGRLHVRVAEAAGGCPPALFVLLTQPPGREPVYFRVCRVGDFGLPVGPVKAPDVAAKTPYRSNEALVAVREVDADEAVGTVRAAVAALCADLARRAAAPAWDGWAVPRE